MWSVKDSAQNQKNGAKSGDKRDEKMLETLA